MASHTPFENVINLFWAIILANLNYYFQLLRRFLAKLSPNFNEFNLPGFEVGFSTNNLCPSSNLLIFAETQ